MLITLFWILFTSIKILYYICGTKANNMKQYSITFGTGKDSVTVIDKGNTINEILDGLKNAGWEVESITKIEEVI